MPEEFHYLYHFYIRIHPSCLQFSLLYAFFFLLSWNYAIAYNVSPWISERDNILQIKRKSIRGLTNCQCNTNPTLIKKRYLYHRLNTILIIIYYFDQNNQNPAKFIKKKIIKIEQIAKYTFSRSRRRSRSKKHRFKKERCCQRSQRK